MNSMINASVKYYNFNYFFKKINKNNFKVCNGKNRDLSNKC